MMRLPDHERFPLWGYAVINLVVIVLTLMAWVATKTGALMLPPASAAGRPAVAALLVFVPLCFFLATVFDLTWRALGRQRDGQAEAADAARVPPTAPKRDVPTKDAPSRDVLSREVPMHDKEPHNPILGDPAPNDISAKESERE